MDEKKLIEEMHEHYELPGKFTGYKPIKEGHINYTFVMQYKEEKKATKEYLIQKINTNVFKNPEELMENIVNVTNYLREIITERDGDPSRETLRVIYTKDDRPYYLASDGSYWRCYDFITDAYTCQKISNPQVFFNAGKAFGEFMSLLADYPSHTLHETIPDFHNTKKRFQNLLAAVERDAAGRAASVQKEIDFVLGRRGDTSVLVDMIENGELPLRVTHNDTKLNNVMFDNQSNQGICVIDLDTVMPGLSLYDFGDAIRAGAATAAEDEKDATKMKLDIELYAQYTHGYLSAAGKSLTDNEIKYLPFSAKLLTLECGMRFLTDYLDGDVYFHTDYDDHNLVRCRTQFALVQDMEKKMDQMVEINEKYRKMVIG